MSCLIMVMSAAAAANTIWRRTLFHTPLISNVGVMSRIPSPRLIIPVRYVSKNAKKLRLPRRPPSERRPGQSMESRLEELRTYREAMESRANAKKSLPSLPPNNGDKNLLFNHDFGFMWAIPVSTLFMSLAVTTCIGITIYDIIVRPYSEYVRTNNATTSSTQVDIDAAQKQLTEGTEKGDKDMVIRARAVLQSEDKDEALIVDESEWDRRFAHLAAYVFLLGGVIFIGMNAPLRFIHRIRRVPADDCVELYAHNIFGRETVRVCADGAVKSRMPEAYNIGKDGLLKKKDSYLPIYINNRLIPYLVDLNGDIPNPKLFWYHIRPI